MYILYLLYSICIAYYLYIYFSRKNKLVLKTRQNNTLFNSAASKMTEQDEKNITAINLQNIKYELDDSNRSKCAIGLVVLATDHTIEDEFRSILNIPGVRYVYILVLFSYSIFFSFIHLKIR